MGSGANGVGGVPGTITTGLRLAAEWLLMLRPPLLLLLMALALDRGREGSEGVMVITSWGCCRTQSSSESESMTITADMPGENEIAQNNTAFRESNCAAAVPFLEKGGNVRTASQGRNA
jgi:hypothetical protein